MNELVEGVDELVGVTGGLALFEAGVGRRHLPVRLADRDRTGPPHARRRRAAPAGRGRRPEPVRRHPRPRHLDLAVPRRPTPTPKCTRLLRFARALERFDHFDAALTKGEIGIDHLRVVVDLANDRIIDAMVELQELFLSMVPGRTFPDGRPRSATSPPSSTTTAATTPTSDLTANRLTITGPGPDTARLLNGQLVGSNGETVRQVLDQIADELFRQFTRDRDHSPDLAVPSRPVLLALALVEACRRAVARPVGTTDGTRDRPHHRRPRRRRPRPDRPRRPRPAPPRLVRSPTTPTPKPSTASASPTAPPDCCAATPPSTP